MVVVLVGGFVGCNGTTNYQLPTDLLVHLQGFLWFSASQNRTLHNPSHLDDKVCKFGILILRQEWWNWKPLETTGNYRKLLETKRILGSPPHFSERCAMKTQILWQDWQIEVLAITIGIHLATKEVRTWSLVGSPWKTRGTLRYSNILANDRSIFAWMLKHQT